MYISSSGEEKDVKTLDYQYLVNALAKSFREIEATNSKEEYTKHNKNITALTGELSVRVIMKGNQLYGE